jgi:hypothetical protein
MPQIDREAAQAVEPDLASGESLIWAGRPIPGTIFHREDLYLIPFSFMWGGFAIFWEASVAGLWGHGSKTATPWTFGMIWGIPFVVIGQYLIWGRFLYTAWKKRRTYYAVTNRRVIVVQGGSSRKLVSAYIDALPTLIRESGSGAAGTLRFGQQQPLRSQQRGWIAWDSMALGTVPIFTDVDNVDGLYRLIVELRERTASARRSD